MELLFHTDCSFFLIFSSSRWRASLPQWPWNCCSTLSVFFCFSSRWRASLPQWPWNYCSTLTVLFCFSSRWRASLTGKCCPALTDFIFIFSFSSRWRASLPQWPWNWCPTLTDFILFFSSVRAGGPHCHNGHGTDVPRNLGEQHLPRHG